MPYSFLSLDMRGQVLLLHSSATDPQLVCKLGQLFSELGFRVFLDLWNQTELGSGGPATWLHSKLDYIQRHGGKALLVLSPTTLQRAELYWKIAVERQSNAATYSSDMLASALGCIFADRQKGCASQRFILVQLDVHELHINEEHDMPKLLRGLPLYKLPSQSQGLLMELCLESPNNMSGKLKKMWWMKKAQRKLAQGVQNIFKSRVRTESMLTQFDSLELSLDTEDTEDTEGIYFLKNEQHWCHLLPHHTITLLGWSVTICQYGLWTDDMNNKSTRKSKKHGNAMLLWALLEIPRKFRHVPPWSTFEY